MASITCGNCKQTHFSVAAVRECYWAAKEVASRPDNYDPGVHLSEREYEDIRRAEEDRVRESIWTSEDSGIYKDPNSDRIFKVYDSINNPGRILCKILVVDKFEKKGRFQYQGMASRWIKHDWKLSLEDAKKFGQIYGVCCMCGRTLTDEESIANGIGPICAGKFSL